MGRPDRRRGDTGRVEKRSKKENYVPGTVKMEETQREEWERRTSKRKEFYTLHILPKP